MSSADIYYTVSFSGVAIDSLRTISSRAVSAGKGQEFIEAVELLQNWLRADRRVLASRSEIWKVST